MPWISRLSNRWNLFFKNNGIIVFCIDSETQEIYLPEKVDPADIRYELLLAGFFMKITKG